MHYDDTTSRPLVSIALATYNGRTYLLELLASLEAQSWPNLEVVVSDDASTDGTPELLAAYAGRVPVRLVTSGERVGIVRNFERALAGCRGEYIALADQDDVWAPEKVTDLMRDLQLVENVRGRSTPALSFCDIELVDATLCCLSKSLFDITAKSRRAERLRDFLLSNHVPGCAMLVNRAALERALPFPARIVMHDWWLAMVVASFGEIRHVAAPHLKYRQHENNAVGASATNQRPGARTECGIEAAERRGASRRRQIDSIADQIRLFARRFGTELPAEAREDMGAFSRGIENWRGAVEFVMISHTGETFVRALKMMRRLRKSVLSFGVDAQQPRFGRRLRRRRAMPPSAS